MRAAGRRYSEERSAAAWGGGGRVGARFREDRGAWDGLAGEGPNLSGGFWECGARLAVEVCGGRKPFPASPDWKGEEAGMLGLAGGPPLCLWKKLRGNTTASSLQGTQEGQLPPNKLILKYKS